MDPWSKKIPRATEQLNPSVTTIEPVLWSQGPTEAHKLQNPRPATRKVTVVRGPLTTTESSPRAAMKTRHNQ